MFARLAVSLAYQLENSVGYKRVKHLCFNVLESPRSRIRPYFDFVMLLLVTASVFVYMFEIKHGNDEFGLIFEQVAVSIFILEYILRLWVCSDSRKIIIEHYERAEFIGLTFSLSTALRAILFKKWQHITSPFVVIDLLAILPAYWPLRILRVLILFRQLKLFRYTHSIQEFLRVLSEKRFELYTLTFFLSFILFTSSTAMFVFEGNLPGTRIHSFSDAVYWSFVTLFTVGYGDITPHTAEGRFITYLLVVSGVGVVAFLTSLLIAAFTEKMDEMREHRIYSEIEKHKDIVIVCGYGRMGQIVVRKLREDRARFVIIDRARERVTLAKKRGYLAIEGDASSNAVLLKLGIRDRVVTVLSLTGDDVLNVYITLTARYLNPKVNIISRANQVESVRKLEQAGANHVIRPFEVVGLTVAEYVGQPVAFEAVYGVVSGEKHLRIEAVIVHAGSWLNGRQLKDIDLDAARLILFGVIAHPCEERQHLSCYALSDRCFYFNPSPEFCLTESDMLVVFGHEYSINYFKEKAKLSRSKLFSKHP